MKERYKKTVEKETISPSGRRTRTKTIEERVSGYDFDNLPAYAKKAFEKRGIPKELYGAAIEVMGNAYGNALVSMGGELVNYNPEQEILVARGTEFDESKRNVIEGIEIKGKKVAIKQQDLEKLMKDLLAHADVPANVLDAAYLQIGIIYDKYEQEKNKNTSQKRAGGTQW